MKKYMIVDMSNILYRNFHLHRREGLDIGVSLTIHSCLVSLNYLYNKYMPTDIVCAFDSSNWRKIYTQSDAALTYKIYKDNRRKNLSDKDKKDFAIFDSAINDTYNFFKKNSSLIILKRPLLEADDLISGFVDFVEADKHILISSDRDYLQLLDNENLHIIDPKTDKELDLSEWDNSRDLFLFEKMIRGDTGDNVMSSYPRLSSKKIKAALNDSELMTNIMNNEFEVEFLDENSNLVKRKYVTKDIFQENEMLMDLRKQPEDIIKLILIEIVSSAKTRGKYNFKEFLLFCKDYELLKIAEESAKYSNMLSLNSGDIKISV